MDFPRADDVGLVNGEFVDENAATGQPGSLIPARWGNAVTKELLAIQAAAGIEADEADTSQVLRALNGLFPRIYSIAQLPTKNAGPVMVAEVGEIWTWSASACFTGYRSQLCGDPLFSARATPLVQHLDAVGGSVSKAAYPGLWGWAQEQGLVVTAANWLAGTHHFVDNGDGTFRLPDLRNQFFRATGTNADTTNARAIGSDQDDSFKSHNHGITVSYTAAAGGVGNLIGGSTISATAIASAGGSETRGQNVAYAPRIHI
ncbi:hypothetical protein [Burkholderia vietnamiensis]|uniref:hypothetical protein n=1 Tax=Burkholderia vietnamiensis TaxID=60552 RepID=UPI0008416599|nr:hypothetical protein [Burkholderia vietnamiensis]AOK40848.1 hypothetical protein WL96_07215 [Burkholderia vietnamiensis]